MRFGAAVGWVAMPPLLFAILFAAVAGSPAHANAPGGHAPPACAYADRRAQVVPADDGRFTLLDTARRLPDTFEPPDLVPLRRAGFDDARRVRAVMIADLAELRAAAEAAGHPLAVQSAYRSYDYQARTFAYWVELDGYEAALRTSARAGHSEHQLGTAVDLRSADGPPAWELADWGATPTGAWVAEHAARFGFVISYPRGAEATACYAYEPWHLRWVGASLAQEVASRDRPLRVVLWERQRAR